LIVLVPGRADPGCGDSDPAGSPSASPARPELSFNGR